MRTVLGLFLAATLALAAWATGDPAERAPVLRVAPAVPDVERFARPGEPESAPAAAEDGEIEEPANEEPAELPPADPVERGECELHLRIVDRATGAPVASKVSLWRLNAPGNEHWTDGDQRQATDTVPVEGKRFADLPAGAYRAYVLGESYLAEGPPAFHVAGPRTELTLAVEPPRKFRVHVRIFDATGAPLHRAKMLGSRHSRTARGDHPEWARRRELRDPGSAISVLLGGSGGGRYGRRSATAGPDGFDLGLVAQDDRCWKGSKTLTLTPPGQTSVAVRIDQEIETERTYYGLSVPIEPLHELVRLPDGRRAIDAGARFYAVAKATLDPDTWRAAAIEVTVRLDGYEKLGFEHRPGEATPAHVLKPK